MCGSRSVSVSDPIGPGVNGLLASIDHGNYGAFINQVDAKCCQPGQGKLFAEAAVLIALAEELSA